MKPNLPRTGLLIASATLATLALAAGPALAAQRGDHGRTSGGQGQGQGQSHAQARQVASPPPMRSAPMRVQPVQSAPMRFAQERNGPVQSAPMRFAQERNAPVRVEPSRSAPVRNEPVRIAPFQNQSRVVSPERRVVGPGPQGVSPERRVVGAQPGRAYYGERSYSDGRTVGNPVIVGHAGPRPVFDNSGRRFFGESRRFVPRSEFEGRFEGRSVFAEPFFRFRPRFRFGFGLIVGYPVAFPYGYYYNPYDYTYGYPVYGFAQPVPTYSDNSYYGSPNDGYADNSAYYGGVTFDIQPTNAAVYVDGKYLGTVAEFSPQQPPLSLTLGRHHVDLRLQGFETMSFDMDVVAGQVIPYQGGMTVIR